MSEHHRDQARRAIEDTTDVVESARVRRERAHSPRASAGRRIGGFAEVSPAGDETRAAELEPPVAVERPDGWLVTAAELLAGDEPGPTPWLVEGLLVDEALGAIVGPPKVGKTWVVLELALAIATGRDVLDRFALPAPGPVVVVLEESGSAALHRRLDQLVRGADLSVEQRDGLARLYVAPNRRVRLDDRDWQRRLADAAVKLEARALFLDPLARLKSPGRDENAQKEMAVVLEYLRDLRDAAGGCAVTFVHHSGHETEHLRGSSDLESWWESKLTIGKSQRLKAEHREAEPTPPVEFRLAFDHRSTSVRLVEVERSRADMRVAVTAYLAENPTASGNEVDKQVSGRRETILELVAELQGGSHAAGTTGNHPSGADSQGGSHEPPHPRRGWGSGTTPVASGSRDPEPGDDAVPADPLVELEPDRQQCGNKDGQP